MQLNRNSKINLLPGPVLIEDDIIHTFGEGPISHRENDFQQELDATKDMLKIITGCNNVELCLGSGSLANDIVAAQLNALGGKGIILSNGEFGERLIDHAARFSIPFEAIKIDWGTTFDYDSLDQVIKDSRFSWIWFV